MLNEVPAKIINQSIDSSTELDQSRADSDILPLSSDTPVAYHEMGVSPIVEIDVLEQLKQNIQHLEDLHGRLKFLMGEVSGLLRKS